jgi:hypothetical protein
MSLPAVLDVVCYRGLVFLTVVLLELQSYLNVKSMLDAQLLPELCRLFSKRRLS